MQSFMSVCLSLSIMFYDSFIWSQIVILQSHYCVFHYMNILQFIMHSIVDGHLNCFLFRAIKNRTTMFILVCIFDG